MTQWACLATFGGVRKLMRAVSVPFNYGLVSAEKCHTLGMIVKDSGEVGASATLWVRLG